MVAQDSTATLDWGPSRTDVSLVTLLASRAEALNTKKKGGGKVSWADKYNYHSLLHSTLWLPRDYTNLYSDSYNSRIPSVRQSSHVKSPPSSERKITPSHIQSSLNPWMMGIIWLWLLLVCHFIAN